MTMRPSILVFSDLDGTLLGHNNYDWSPARPTLARLQDMGAGVVLATSKTAAEVHALREEIGFGGWPSIVENGGGVVSAEAREAFQAALSINNANPGARFYLAVAAEQDGDFETAHDRWAALLALADETTAWRPQVEMRLARTAEITGRPAEPAASSSADASGPDPDAVASAAEAASDLTEAERRDMVRQMITSLDERLKSEGGTAAEWGMLLRSYTVLGETAAAAEALERGRSALKDQDSELSQLNAIAFALGLGQDGETLN